MTRLRCLSRNIGLMLRVFFLRHTLVENAYFVALNTRRVCHEDRQTDIHSQVKTSPFLSSAEVIMIMILRRSTRPSGERATTICSTESNACLPARYKYAERTVRWLVKMLVVSDIYVRSQLFIYCARGVRALLRFSRHHCWELHKLSRRRRVTIAPSQASNRSLYFAADSV